MNGAEALRAVFDGARAAGSRALITYLCAGDPDPQETYDLLLAVAEGGTDIIELGIPFSDPAADGPVIQQASQRALQAGTRVRDALDACRRFTDERPDVPVVLFGYWNPWHRLGATRTAALAAEAGAAGMLVVDLPLEESEELDAACAAKGLARVLLAAPTADRARLARISARATGFVYVVSLMGVTGRALVQMDAARALTADLASLSDLPVAVGFGVDGPERAREVSSFADGVVVGSALVARIAGAGTAADRRVAAREFTATLKRSLST